MFSYTIQKISEKMKMQIFSVFSHYFLFKQDWVREGFPHLGKMGENTAKTVQKR